MSSALQDPMNPARVSAAAKRAAADLDVVDDGKTYPVELFKRVAGLSNWAFRQAKREGLKVRTAGRRSYVRGRDWSDFLAAQD